MGSHHVSQRDLIMADPLQQLGISRRPADVLFGSPNMSGGTAAGWTRAAVEQDEADKALRDEELAKEDERAARARSRQAEQAADQFIQTEPTSRQKFLEDNPAIVGSKRYNEIESFQKAQPSYADRVLAKSIALKFEDPDARQVFQQGVSQGLGTLAAQDAANTFLAKKQAAGELGKYYPPDEAEAMVANRHDPAYINYHVAKKKGETLFHKDPQAQALERYYHTLRDRAAIEAKDMHGSGEALPETTAEMARVSKLLGSKYQALAEPVVPGVTIAPPTPTNSAEAKASLLKKLGLVKP